MYDKQTKGQNFTHSAKKRYIGLDFEIIAEANEQIDSISMVGFDPKELNKLLGLSKKGLKCKAILALGYRDNKKDWLVKLKKVHMPLSKFVNEMKS